MLEDNGTTGPTASEPPPPGVMISRGVTPRIPAGGLVIGFGADGKQSMRVEKFELALDVCPIWLEIAAGHLDVAKSASERLRSTVQSSDQARVGQDIEEEFRASIQSVVASAVAVESMYASLRLHNVVDAATRKSWRDNKTARYVQVAETVRRAFRIKDEDSMAIRRALKDLYDARDNSVHPDGDFAAPLWHPDARVFVAEFLATFRYPNARQLAGIAPSLVAQCSRRANLVDGELRSYCEAMQEMIAPVLERWESAHGRLFERDAG